MNELIAEAFVLIFSQVNVATFINVFVLFVVMLVSALYILVTWGRSY